MLLVLSAARLALPRACHLPALRHASTVAMEPPSPQRPRPRPDPLGDEMKAYEAATCDAAVDMSRPCVVRLDGHCFSTFTRGFDRPYDLRIHRAMVGTSTDLLERFGAATAYTESDEISLLFAPPAEDAPDSSALPFNGRVQKIVSVFAGYASARFNAHMLREDFDAAVPAQAALRERVERSEAHFDARVFSLPSLGRLCEYMRWRALLDCRRNSISMLAQAHFPHQELQGVDANTCLRMLSAKGVEWSETPSFFRYGTYVKKEEWSKPAFNPKTQQPVVARRTRAAARSFELPPADEPAAFLLTRLWPAEAAGAASAGAPSAAATGREAC